MASIDQPRNVGRQPARLVAPAKALRLRGALRAGVGELDRVALDEVARRRMVTTHRAVLVEVASTVSDALVDELARLGMAPLDQAAGTDELRVAQAQLLGWLDGVLFAQASVGGQDGTGPAVLENGVVP
jgi:Protein of unknown function (DUF2587)